MQCVVCDGVSGRVVWSENGYDGLICDCGTVYTSPEPRPEAVDPRRDCHPHTFYSSYAMFKARWVQRFRRNGRLLEIGSGEGYFAEAAKSLGYEVTAVEPHAERARRIRARLGITVQCALLEELKWSGDSFDVVYHCDLLSHFPDPHGALRKMAAMLNRDGILCFEAGTLGGIAPSWYRRIGQLGFPQHRWLYSEASLRRLLTTAGLQIIRMQHFGLAPAVALHRARVFAARCARTLQPRTSGTSPARPPGIGRTSETGASGLYDSIEQFVRYRLGKVAPRLGPATWLIAARPNQENSL
jgi:SAM-dependent methyltransferase